MAAEQRSFADLGLPLQDVTFCTVDLETTGGSVHEHAITEIGAVRTRGGETLGTFQTLVNPGQRVPPEITVLTGITESMVLRAPAIVTVLPTLLDFIGNAVIVGHNVRFDVSFLNAALRHAGHARLANDIVDTLALARRLFLDDTPNCRLSTLADRLRLAHRPSHRALDDALATVDLLHALLERAATFGVLGLDDLIHLPKIGAHPQAGKLRLTNDVPRTPGVYMFTDRRRQVLYVGKAANLRTRVRSYFSGDRRKKVAQLLRETEGIEWIECAAPLEVDVVEARLIHEHQPRFNRRGKTWRRYAYLKLTDERFARLSIVKAPRDDKATYLGPLPSRRVAKLISDAIHSATRLRRCTSKGAPAAPCAPAQLGVAACPCSGFTSPYDYDVIVDQVRRGLSNEPRLLLDPLEQRMYELATAQRFEEAADVRTRAQALAAALGRQRQVDSVRAAGRVVIEEPGRGYAEIADGRLVRAWSHRDTSQQLPIHAPAQIDGPIPAGAADEMRCVASWLEKKADHIRIVHADHGLASALPQLPSFEPASGIKRKADG